MEDRNRYKIHDNGSLGEVQIADESSGDYCRTGSNRGRRCRLHGRKHYK